MSAPSAAVAALRRAFDDGFAAPVRQGATDHIDLLAIRVAGHACCVRLLDVAGLHATRKIVAVPSAMPELLGISGLRGGLVPVYQIGALLGHGGQAPDALPWMVVCGAPDLVGLAFDGFEGHLRAARAEVRLAGPGAAAAQMSQLCQVDRPVRRIIDVPALIEGLKRRVGAARATKERS